MPFSQDVIPLIDWLEKNNKLIWNSEEGMMGLVSPIAEGKLCRRIGAVVDVPRRYTTLLWEDS
jgi:hypothetical protein